MLRFIFSLLLVIATENFANACATCGSVDASSPYFLKMIVFMTALPVICVGSAVWYLRSQREKNDSNE